MRVTLGELEDKYRESADPWNFCTSRYEQEKFVATRNALSRQRYHSALELGCGNGALAKHLAPLCDLYCGVDGVSRAVAAARRAVPDATIVQAYFPCDLPSGAHDLIVLSEILYFLGREDIRALAEQITRRWPEAEILCVSYLGPTGNPLQGEEALEVFRQTLGPGFNLINLIMASGYRIDRHVFRHQDR